MSERMLVLFFFLEAQLFDGEAHDERNRTD
jgi:hypothetical protein